MKTLWIAVALSLANAASAQKPTGEGVVTGTLITGVTPENRQIDPRAKIFLELSVRGKSWRYPTRIAWSSPGHFFQLDCKAKGLPTGVILSDLKLVVIEPGKPGPLVCTPENFDGRVLLLSSSRATATVDGARRRAAKPLTEEDIDRQKTCPTGLKYVSGLHFNSQDLRWIHPKIVR